MSERTRASELSGPRQALLEELRRSRGLASGAKVAIARRSISAPLLSFGQERFWILDRLTPGSSAYNVPFVLRVEGPLDEEVLRLTFDALLARHEVLRTAYVDDKGRPAARLLPGVTIQFDRTAAAGLPDDAVNAAVAAEVARPFDLARPPLLRVHIISLGSAQLVVLTMHHIVADAATVGILFREALMAYSAFAAGRAPSWPPTTIDYADFAAWQRAELTQAVVDEHVAFWRAALGDAPRTVDLPRAVAEAQGDEHLSSRIERIDFEGQLAPATDALARAHGATPFMVLLAAWGIVLCRYGRQEQIVVGCPFSGRDRPETRDVVGYFLNTIPVLIDVRGAPTFGAVVERVRDFCLQAFQHQTLPLERLQFELRRTGGATGALFDTIFAYYVDTRPEPRLGDLRFSIMDAPPVEPRFDLAISLRKHGQSLRGGLQMRPTVLSGRAGEELASAFQVLLRAALEAPELAWDELPMVDPRASHVAATDGRGPQRDWDGPADVLGMVEAIALKAPDSVAIELGELCVDYRQLIERSLAFSTLLIERGVEAGDVIAIELDRSLELVVAILGALAAGAAYLPLDPAYPEARRRFMTEDSSARLVVVADGGGGTRYGRATISVSDSRPRRPVDRRPIAPDSIAYIIYTSGSSGEPKGVAVRHGGVANMVRAQIVGFEIGARSRVLQFAALSFDASVSEVFTALAAGATLVLPGPSEIANDLTGLLRSKRVSVVTLPPSVLLALDPSRLPDVRTVVSAGESCLPEIVRRWSIGRRMINAYGPTEATVCATLGEAIVRGPRVSAGLPLANVHVRVLDHRLRALPNGAIGEVYIGGAGVAAGYVGRPELTAQKFILDPWPPPPAGRMYASGDLGRFCADGHLEILGRIDDQVKIRGFRIELGEIESRMAEVPGVRETAVVVKRTGAGSRLVAFAAIGEIPSTDGDAIRRHLAAVLPAHMIPGAIETRAALPRTPAGKIDRAALVRGATTPEGLRRMPSTPNERDIADVWKVVLALDDIALDDNFFHIGGDSILAIQLAGALQRALLIPVSPSFVFENPTLEAMAGRMLDQRPPPSVDWGREATLDASVRPPPGESAGVALTFLLTGATGFLGAFLLRTLLDSGAALVICIVRAPDSVTGTDRVLSGLRAFGLEQRDDQARICVRCGDLDLPRLGLDESTFALLASTVDAVVHNGARVNFMVSYTSLAASNVGGTLELLRLAATERVKPIAYVSSLSVFGDERFAEPVTETTESGPPERLRNGYAQSKWVGDALTRAAFARGMPASVFRCGAIAGDSRTGAFNESDLLAKTVRACLLLGAAPDVEMTIDMTPVDYVAGAIVWLLQNRAGGVYHLANPSPIGSSSLAAWARARGYPLESLPLDEWRARLARAARRTADPSMLEVAAVTGLAAERRKTEGTSPQPRFDSPLTRAALHGSGVECAPVEALLDRYLAAFVERGHVPRPTR